MIAKTGVAMLQLCYTL